MYISEMKPYEGKGKYIFVSYSHKDADEVPPILDELTKKGYRIWHDEEITPGDEFAENIAKHLKVCEICITFISQNYMNSGNCMNEMNYAITNRIKLLPVFSRIR